MEFQEFWKQRERMCKQQVTCCPNDGEDCPIAKLGSINRLSCCEIIGNHAAEAEQIVEQWAKEHPIVTNGQKYQEIMKSTFGEAYPNGVMGLNTTGGEHGIQYTDDWWNAEYQPQKEIMMERKEVDICR